MLLCTGTCACGPTESDHVLDVTYSPCALVIEVDSSAAPDEVQSIDTAIVLWNEAGGFGLTRDAKETLPRLRVQFEKALSSFRGVYDDERGVVIINERLDDPRALALTVAHELGHAFGLWHVASSSRTSLMNPGVVTVEPTPEDVNEVRAIWGSCGFTPESN